MFTPPRFVAVDDKPEHLTPILSVFQQLGTPCLGIEYDAEHGLGGEAQRNLRGVRVLFLDLHLTDSVVATDYKRHFGTIAELLETNISRTGGPFILVVWTSFEDEVEQLGHYLNETFDPAALHALPLAVIPLAKNPFIKQTGELHSDTADSLRKAVTDAVNKIPQLAALVAWEIDVQAAAGATLSALVQSVPESKRTTTSIAGGLGHLLAQLASASAGEARARADPRSAVTSALAPILADRIVHQESLEPSSEQWQAAPGWDDGSSLEPEAAARINRMVHIASAPSETLQPDVWGAVVEFPDALWNDEAVQHLFGVTQARLLCKEFKIEANQDELQRRRLVRIGAVCDYAQNHSGPLTYLFGIEIPPKMKRDKRPPSVWNSPPLLLNSEDGPFQLDVSARFSLSITSDKVTDWKPTYRLREQLLMHLISHASNHLSRPGILQLR